MYLFDDWKYRERIASPLNYTGGKFRLLPQILPLFPEKIRWFADVFCGGGNVGVNVDAERILLNDKDSQLTGLLEIFRRVPVEKILTQLEKYIREYGLSVSSEMGYEHYGANGADGLANFNRVAFLKMRKDFNTLLERNDDYYVRLYLLIVYAFNNQIRFNREGKYNLPVGKRDFNLLMRKKLSKFVERLHEGIFTIENQDFRAMDFSRFTREDLVYADPPYLITCAAYNEQGGWKESDEWDLLQFLDGLHEREIRFALSNVLKSKGRENTLLQSWISSREEEYTVHHLRFHYANSNYQTKDRTCSSDEVLITNY